MSYFITVLAFAANKAFALNLGIIDLARLHTLLGSCNNIFMSVAVLVPEPIVFEHYFPFVIHLYSLLSNFITVFHTFGSHSFRDGNSMCAGLKSSSSILGSAPFSSKSSTIEMFKV